VAQASPLTGGLGTARLGQTGRRRGASLTGTPANTGGDGMTTKRHVYVPKLMDGDLHTEEDWQKTLAADYRRPQYHVSYLVAVARRVRSNHLLIQTMAYMGKLMVHPVAVGFFCEFVARADIGPVPGEAVLMAGGVYIATGIGLVVWVNRIDRQRSRERGGRGTSMG
jgi:uncharacterized membrane protein